MQLTMSVGEAVTASPILFEAVRFALTVAEETVAHSIRLSAIAWKRGDSTARIAPAARSAHMSRRKTICHYRDVEVDAARRTIRLRRPLLLDLAP